MSTERTTCRRRPTRSRLRRRRQSLLCCLLLPSSVPAASHEHHGSFASTRTRTTSTARSTDHGTAHDNTQRRDLSKAPLSSHSRNHGILNRVRQCPHLGCFEIPRGGETAEDVTQQMASADDGDGPAPPTLKSIKADDDDEKIDAYIEQLIASVEDESGDKRLTAGTNNHVEQGGVGVGVAVTKRSDDGEAEAKSPQEAEEILSVRPDPGNDPDTAAASGDEAELEASDVGSTEALIDDDDSASHSADARAGEPQSQAIHSSVEEVTSCEVQSTTTLQPPSRKPRKTALPPPNPLYRALLRRRGWGGHVVAMALVTVSEFCDLWLPLVVRAWDAIVRKRLVGDPSHRLDEADAAGRRRRRPPASATELESKVRSSQRSGTNRKHLKELQRQADQAALQVLRQLKKDSKYRYTSLAFQQRHGLGQFATAASRVPESSKPGQSRIVARTSSSGAKTIGKTSRDKGTNDDDDDVDWILDALTATNDEELADKTPTAGRSASTSKAKASVQPRVAVELGPDGPAVSVGMELSLGGSGAKRRKGTSPSLESVIRGANAKQRSTKSTVSKVVTSDRDSGVLGRIRAAASEGIGRSLLGAYPGDAAPISEAANPRGVLELASRYGYGDWSELDDDDDEESEHDEPVSRKRRRSTRRKKSESSRPVRTRSRSKSRKGSRNVLGVGFDFELGSGLDNGLRSSARDPTKDVFSPSRSPSRHPDTLTTMSSRQEHRSAYGRSVRSSTTSRSAAPVSAAMERTNEARRKVLPGTGRGAPIAAAIERVNKKRRESTNLDDEG